VAATTFLRTQLQQPVTLGDLAQALNLSCRTATRRLAEQGVSFQGLLDQLRREQADALLARRAARVADVAAAVGFSDPSNFRRAYQRWTGRPPRAPCRLAPIDRFLAATDRARAAPSEEWRTTQATEERRDGR
jgi:AraC-like DNA-binding protein